MGIQNENDIESTKAALTSSTVPVLGKEKNENGECIGLQV